MQNKKAFVFGETKGLNENLNQSNLKSSLFPRQYLCSFCWRELPNNSIRFNGIDVCPLHFALCNKLIDGLREQQRNYAKKSEGENDFK